MYLGAIWFRGPEGRLPRLVPECEGQAKSKMNVGFNEERPDPEFMGKALSVDSRLDFGLGDVEVAL